MPYKAPDSHVWFRSPSPIYSPPTPPPATPPQGSLATDSKQAAASKPSVLLRIIEDAAAITYDIARSRPAKKRKPEEAIAASDPASMRSSKPQGIDSYFTPSQAKRVKGKRPVNSSKPSKASSAKPQSSSKIVFDRFPPKIAQDKSLPIIAGFQKQHSLAQDRSSYRPSPQEDDRGTRQQAIIQSTLPISSPPAERLDSSWITENLDALLPPLSPDELAELHGSLSYHEADQGGFRSSPPTYYDEMDFKPKQETMHEALSWPAKAPLAKPSAPRDDIISFVEADDLEHASSDNATVVSEIEILLDHQKSLSSRPSGRPEFGTAHSATHSSAFASASVSSAANPYDHPDFSHKSDGDWSTLSTSKRGAARSPTPAAKHSGKFKLPSTVFGQVARAPRATTAVKVDPLPLRKGVQLFKPSPVESMQPVPIYSVKTKAALRYGPASNDNAKHATLPTLISTPSASRLAPSEHASAHRIDAPVPNPKLNKYSFDQTSQAREWSEFGGLHPPSVPRFIHQSPPPVEQLEQCHDSLRSQLQTALYDDPLCALSEPPASPTFDFSLQQCELHYPLLRKMIEVAASRGSEKPDLKASLALRDRIEGLIYERIIFG